ncbi:MAG: hypothetical protein M3N43_00765 [Actinomycetota bacterium]|nr:hypothetical protein [Actinomycetota bacterium]
MPGASPADSAESRCRNGRIPEVGPCKARAAPFNVACLTITGRNANGEGDIPSPLLSLSKSRVYYGMLTVVLSPPLVMVKVPVPAVVV